MGLKDFFSKSTGNAALKDCSEDMSAKDNKRSTPSTTSKRKKLPNALRTVNAGSAAAAVERERQASRPAPRLSILKTKTKQSSQNLEREITQEQIALRAWSIWQEKGCPQGQDFQNWVQAEQELRAELK
ncbi:MAG: DUF2934 domain-containing protein [Bdellovibrionota bacterium]|jgi:uncharacterized protein YdaU (DUF1376 family)